MQHEGRKYWYNLRKVDVEYLRKSGGSLDDLPVLSWEQTKNLEGSLWVGNDAVRVVPDSEVDPALFLNCGFIDECLEDESV